MNHNIKTIIFDFDGVIADSVDVKTKAFRGLYLKYGIDVADKVEQHHLLNGGMSRFDKFKYYHRTFLGKEITKDEIETLSVEFSNLVVQGVIKAPEVKGSHDFINSFKDQFNMFIITGTPTLESIEICKRRGIFSSFKGIFGSPNSKEKWCKHIINEFNTNPEETIFLGDAMADYQAAVSAGFDFYLRENEDNQIIFKDNIDLKRFGDFIEFQRYLNVYI